MSLGSIGPGCVIYWKEYQFADGETANKFLVILGAKAGSNYLAVIATSQPHRMKFQAGCNAKDSYYHIPAKKEWFEKDTWILLAAPVELHPGKLIEAGFAKQVVVRAQLRTDIANGIKNCLKQCRDVSALHVSLL